MNETKTRNYSPWIREAWAAWEMLRKLGFKAEDIFWVFVPTANAIPRPGIALNIVLRTQDKELAITCSHRLSEGESRRLERSSRTFQETLSLDKFDEADLRTALEASYVWKNQAGLIAQLISKGFSLPYANAKMN